MRVKILALRLKHSKWEQTIYIFNVSCMIACLWTVNKTFGGPHFSALSGVINEHQIPCWIFMSMGPSELAIFLTFFFSSMNRTSRMIQKTVRAKMNTPYIRKASWLVMISGNKVFGSADDSGFGLGSGLLVSGSGAIFLEVLPGLPKWNGLRADYEFDCRK